MGEKERFEVLLEDIRDSVKRIAEGHDSLRREMEKGFHSLAHEISDLRGAFKIYAKQSEHRFEAIEAKIK